MDNYIQYSNILRLYLGEQKIEKYVYNWQAYNTLNSLPSDHRVVTMKMKLSFPKHKTESRGRNYDWAISENKEIKDIYYVEVQNIL